MMFLSGSAMPFAFLPEGVKRFARLLPTTYLNEIYSGVIVRGEGLWTLAGSLAVLLAIGAVGIVLTSSLFRWEGTEPIPRRSLALVASVFVITLGVSAFAAPVLKMGDLPGSRRIEAGDSAGQIVVLRGATVLDGLGGRIVNARVTIRDHRIAEVSLDDDRVPLPANARIDDLHGQYLIPGLFDSHVHWGGSGGVGGAPIEQTPDRLAHDLETTLAAGVTSVVSLTDNVDDMQKLATDVAAGHRFAPRTFYSGPSVTAKGGHPSEMFSFVPGLADVLTRQVETPEAARAAIAELDRRGVDLVKLVLEPGFDERPMPRLKNEMFRAAVDEAVKRHLRTTVHVGTDADVRLAIEAGANGIEHAARGLTDETIALMAAKKITFTPTLVVLDWPWKRGAVRGEDPDVRRMAMPQILQTFLDPHSPLAPMLNDAKTVEQMDRVHEGTLRQVSSAIRAGVPILAGSDAGNPVTFHGISLIRELELLAKAGLPPMEVLKSATSRAADRLGQSQLGRITAGAVADLVVLQDDPSTDVGAYRRAQRVYLGGRVVGVR